MKRDRSQSDLALYQGIPNLPVGYNPALMGGIPGAGAGAGDAQGESLWSVIDDRMRGRWRWAILLGLAVALVLGFLGYRSAEPMFQTVGAIRITPQVTPVLYENVSGSTLPYYEKFVATQVQLIRTPRVLENALTHEEFSKTDFAKQKGAAKALKRGLNAEPDRDSDLIFVAFEHEDPKIAHGACTAILWSYYELYGKNNGQDIPTTLTVLEDIERQRKSELQSILQERENITSRHQTTDLRALEKTNTAMISDLDAKIRMGRRVLEQAQANNPEAPPGTVTQVVPKLQALIQDNPKLARLKDELDTAEIDFARINERYMPGTKQYNVAERRAAQAKAMFEEEYQKALKDWSASPLDLRSLDGRGETVTDEDIKLWEKDLAALRERQKSTVADLATLEDLIYREEQAKLKLTEVDQRKRELMIEQDQLTRFISIADNGALADEPYEDARKKRAIMGAGAGMIASFGLFFLLGTLDRRAYGASQLQQGQGSAIPNCLGVLPDLGASLSDPEQSDVASHCVHQIRNQIEAMREPHGGYVLAVSSPFQGDGKTSIVMALGWSYAAAGYKTLLVDCDMVGRSLTRQMGLTGQEGLKEALINRELNGAVNPMPVDHLSAVGVGMDARFGAENVRRVDLEKLMDDVRDRFDIIIIDTGPMLGSLESTPVTAMADGVVLSVRRGRSRNRLEECVSRLRLVGTQCVGVILNCAVRSDCNRYVSEASLAAAEEQRVARQGEDGPHQPGPRVSERNALVQAMLDSARNRQGDAGEP